VTGDGDSSLGLHASSDEEPDSVSDWEVGIHSELLLDGPLLVGAVVAVPRADWLVVVVTASDDVHALLSLVLELLVVDPAPSLVMVVEVSGDKVGSSSDLELVAPSDTNGEVSPVGLSDRVGSSVEDELLVEAAWVVVSHSEDVLVASNMLSDLDGSLGVHLGSDMELLSVSVWVVVPEWRKGVSGPGLVQASVALPGAQVVVVGVSASDDVHAVADWVP